MAFSLQQQQQETSSKPSTKKRA
ncbi:hypothetical protein CCACVL1_27696 [Corchorus capsularis]|uniref:Uncharacterized protein n=1 Tax=Corchorus capsularis TaxID=210143 RepID=A0A1R3G9F6_COCAP|nr:hypothetical protein CCACVL1_27696 [Corchorus capsularis]